jgi:acyl carrier protein
VFHLAGVPGGGMVELRTRAEAEKVLAPKVAGTLALHRVLNGRVDFIYLFSSITSVTADFGMVDYCAANNFQDGFARRARALGQPVFATSWALWHRGMGANVDIAAQLIYRDVQAGVRSELVAHPLIDRRVHDGGDDLTFSLLLNPTSTWVVTEHTISGVPVVPGTAVVEMIRAAYTAVYGVPAEVRDVVFIGPISIAVPTELQLVLRPVDHGCEVVVIATEARPGAGRGAEHVRAFVSESRDPEPPRRDVAAMLSRFDAGHDARGARPDTAVTLGAHWDNVDRVHLGDGEALARIELDARFWSECDEYVLHPALLDGALTARGLLGIDVQKFSPLPLSYGKIVARAPLPPKFDVHITYVDTGNEGELASNVAIIDEHGREIVTVERFVLKLLARDTVESDVGERRVGGVSVGLGAVGGDRPWSISEEVGLEALRRILHWRPKPHLVLCPEGLAECLARNDEVSGERVEKALAEGILPKAATMGERHVDTPYSPPENDTQALLVELLEKTLGLDRVGVDDDFFELGGNSLAAVQIGFRLREHFGMDVPTALLYEQPTVRGLAAAAEKVLRTKSSPLSDQPAGARHATMGARQ